MAGPPSALATLRCAAAQAGERACAAVLPRFRRGVAATSGQVARYAQSWTDANQLARAGEGPLWAVLGDSAAQGIGASSYDRGYVGLVRRRLEERDGRPWRVLNLSRSGARVADVVRDQLPLLDALDPPPDLVTCVVGGNDLVHTPVPSALASFRTLLAALPRGAVIGTLPRGLAEWKARRVNAQILRDAARHGLRVADIWQHTGPPWRGKYAEDFFHPNDIGYGDWADAISGALALPADRAAT